MKTISSARKAWNKLESSPPEDRGGRGWLFLGTYAVGAVIAGLISGRIYPPALFFFPAGLSGFQEFSEEVAGTGIIFDLIPPACSGAVLYAALGGAGILVNNPRAFRVLYIVFLLVVIVNIAGCTQLSRPA